MQVDQEVLQQALLEVEHLRQLETRSRRNAEAMLEGLELLSSAHSQKDSVLAILSVLTSIIDFDAAAVLCEVEPGKVISLAETEPRLRVLDGGLTPTLVRAFGGRPVVLSNAMTSDWAAGLACAGYETFESVTMLPVTPVDHAALIVCMHKDRAQYSKSDHERLRYFIPLAAHAIRHSFKLAELRRVVAELDQARSAAEASARTDPLTGLANRTRLEEHIAKTLRDGESCCFALIDLNGFKPINDNFGHHAGDHVLTQIGARLKRQLGAEALVARIGGDEFGVVTKADTSRPAMEELGEIICAAFEEPVRLQAHRFEIGASVGIARTGEGDQTAENVLLLADSAMYSVKTQRQTGFAIGPPLSDAVRKSFINPKSLSEALCAGEIMPFYQPQYDVKTGQIVGLEVLARWQHPHQGLMAPAEFIPEIEHGGLSGRFTCIMLRNSLQQCQTWLDQGIAVPDLAINIAEANLTSFTATEGLLDVLIEFPSMLGKVVFEITEGVFLGRFANQTAETLAMIADAGVRLSLDDFGTGFATLANLSRLRFNEIKIDRTFVAGIGIQRRNEVIIEAVVSIAHAHNARVVAEGVETRQQYEFLRRIGCEMVQGYLLGKPADADRTAERLTYRVPMQSNIA